MPYRDAVLDYQLVQTDTQTYDKKLDLTDPISAILLEILCTNGATSNKDNWLTDIVTKIEVVDGSEVLYSVTGIELAALQWYWTKKVPPMFFSEAGGGGQRMRLTIPFGRYLWDPAYAFNPGQYKNPRLHVTFNKAAVRAAAATAFAAGDNIYITAICKVMEGMSAGGSGYLMTKEVASYAQAASGERRIELPTDLTYRMLMVRSALAAKDIDENITDLKLTFDTDKFIMFNRKVAQLDAEELERSGEGAWANNIKRQNENTVNVIWNKEPRPHPVGNVDDTPRNLSITWAWSGQYALQLYTMGGVAVAADELLWVETFGHSPFSTLPVWFGLQDQPDTWFDPRPFKKMELVLTEAQLAAASIVVQQVRA